MKRTLIIAFAVLGQALAIPVAAHDTFVCWAPKTTTPALTASVTDYWTDERQKQAIPLFDGTPPKGGRKADDLEAAQPADVTKDPYKRGGKLYFSMAGHDYVASAQFVDDRILLTAAHAIWKGADASTNIIFKRAYNGGGGTIFTVDLAAVLRTWVPISADRPSAARSNNDYAVLRVTKDSDGGKFAIARSTDFLSAVMMGYPAALQGGQYMYSQPVSNLVGLTASGLVGVPFNLSPGASGGAWFIDDASLGYPLVSVVSSFWGENAVTGPMMTTTTTDMIAYVKGGCP